MAPVSRKSKFPGLKGDAKADCALGTPLFLFAISSLCLIVAYLIYMSCVMKMDLFDSFSIYLNSRGIATGNVIPYDRWRPPFLPIVLAPFFWLDQFIPGPWTGIILSRITSVLFFAGTIVMTWRLFRLHAGPTASIAGAALLALNRLLLHYAPFTKEDIPSTFFLVVSIYYYLIARESGKTRHWVFACLSIAGAFNSRFNLLPPLFALLFVFELASGGTRLSFSDNRVKLDSPDFFKKIGYLCAIPTLLFLLVPTLLYAAIGIAPLSQATSKFLEERAIHLSLLKGVMIPYSQSLYLNAVFLLKSLTWPVAVLSILGVVYGLVKKGKGTLLYVLWFLFFAGVQIFMIRHIESRYQFPFYIPCYFFAAMGLSCLIGFLNRSFAKVPALLNAAIVLVSLLAAIVPVREGIRELTRMTDPFYHSEIMKEVSEYAGELAGENDIKWIGGMFSLHPKDYVFHSEDTFTYLYHFYNHTIRFFTGKRVTVYAGASVIAPEKARQGLYVVNVRDIARDGDVLIVNPEEESFNTKTLPAELPPLLVQKVRMIHFYPPDHFGGAEPTLYQNRDIAGARIEVLPAPEQKGYSFKGSGLRDGIYELSANLEGQSVPAIVTMVKVENGSFEFIKQNYSEKIRLLVLVYYDPVVPFFHP